MKIVRKLVDLEFTEEEEQVFLDAMDVIENLRHEFHDLTDEEKLSLNGTANAMKWLDEAQENLALFFNWMF